MLASHPSMIAHLTPSSRRPVRAPWLAVGVAALGLASLAAVARAEDARVLILHTTDLHGAFDSWDYGADVAAARGLTRIGTLVKRARTEKAGVLLLDAGDAIQGGGASEFLRDPSGPDPMMSMMNAL